MLAIEMNVEDWLRIDGAMDNEIRSLREKAFESETPGELNPYWVNQASLAEQIRKSGAVQLPDWPTSWVDLQSWPAEDRKESFNLTRRQWEMILSALKYWAEVEAELDPEADDALNRIAGIIQVSIQAGDQF